jgi:hypothetical protein
MPMPETPVHKDDLAETGKDKIRRSGKITSMKAESITEPMRRAAHGELGLRFSATNSAHHGRAIGSTEGVHAYTGLTGS